MGCRGVPILLPRLLSYFLKTAAVSAQVFYPALQEGGGGGEGLETFDSLDLMKDKIVESTSSFGYFSSEKIDLRWTVWYTRCS